MGVCKYIYEVWQAVAFRTHLSWHSLHAELAALLAHGASSRPSPDKKMPCILERNADILVAASSRASAV